MICFLARFFIPNYYRYSDPKVRQGYGVLSGVMGVAFNVFLFLSKLFAGLISGSISIINDAVNNLSDAASSVVTLVGFKLSGQEADEEHPFGHGRAEYIAGLIVSFLIILTGAELVQQSYVRIISPSKVEISTAIIVILVISIVVKLIMFFANMHVARLIRSATIKNTAIDSISDVVTTSMVLISIIIEMMTGYNIDGYIGIVVALLIIKAGIDAARDTINPLLGEPPSKELIADIKITVLKHKEILGVHDIVVHNYGPSRIFMSLHVEVPADRDLVTIHDIIDDIEEELHKKYHCTAVIHMDPVIQNNEAVAELKRKVMAIIEEIGPELDFHDFRIVHPEEADKKKKLSFDLQVPYGFRLSDDELIDYISPRIREIEPGLKCDIKIDKNNEGE